MGVFQRIRDRFIDKIYDQVSAIDGREGVEPAELYVAILLMYNRINKFTPGKWMEPPKKTEVFKQLEAFDKDKDKVLNKEEFRQFCSIFFPDLFKGVARNLLISVIILPMLLGWAVDNLKIISKVIPAPILSALFLAFLNFTGFMKVIDEWLDRMFAPKHAHRPGYAPAYPYGGAPYPYPPPGAPAPQGGAAPYPYPPPGAPVPQGGAYPYPPTTAQAQAGATATGYPVSAPSAPPMKSG